VIRAYLDESGHEQDYVILAGHAGTFAEWIRFAVQWHLALGPQRKRLHMKNLRWSKPATKRLLAALGPLPSKCGLVRLFGGVRVSDYADLVTGTRVEKMFKGYIPALFTAISHLIMSLPDDERLEVVFEEQREYERHVHAAMTAICYSKDPRYRAKDGTRKLARWVFLPKDDEPLFDQADYTAYALLQRCRDPNSTRAKWCAPILAGRRVVGEILNREQARKSLFDTAKKTDKLKLNRSV